MKRKPISKKLRFEIFKRDGFKCGYCGKEPPSVVLEIDHIEPLSKGGENDINNYITACFDCNRGKKNTRLSKIPPQMSENLDVLKEKENQLKEYRKYIKKIKQRELKDINEISEVYESYYQEWQFSDSFKQTSLKKFLSLLQKHEVEDALFISINKFPQKPQAATKYFCGVCWGKIKADDPKKIISTSWVGLSKKYRRGSGYYNKYDLELIKNIHIDTLKAYMTKALNTRSGSYWKSFMNLLESANLL